MLLTWRTTRAFDHLVALVRREPALMHLLKPISTYFVPEPGRMLHVSSLRRISSASLQDMQRQQEVHPQKPLHRRVCLPKVHELRSGRTDKVPRLLSQQNLFFFRTCRTRWSLQISSQGCQSQASGLHSQL